MMSMSQGKRIYNKEYKNSDWYTHLNIIKNNLIN